MTRSHAWESAQAAAASIAPESNLFARLDPVGFGAATWAALADVAAQPERATLAAMRFAADMALIAPVAFARSAGMAVEPPLPVDARDKRFADPAWRDHPVFFAVQQAFAARQRFANELVALCVDDEDRAKAELALSLLFDAWCPTNFLATNPAALKRAIDTGGTSVMRGVGNFVDDLLTNNGRPRQVDSRPFHLGQNLAATPGKVVYRSELMELIQYLPQTETVHSVPVLASPPWINKYYIMDLAPGRSFLEWAVQHGRTVFVISYRNPDQTMRDIGLDDYLVQGPRAALDVIEEITGSSVIDVVGLCLGGALTAVAAAYLSRIGDPRIGTLTLLNTLLDYSEPGQLGVFTDSTTVVGLERKMARAGVLGGEDMAGTFDILRANDLIFNYVVSNWLMGESPPAFDILAWNSDNTRMPARMHSFYLHSFYLENQLAHGQLEIIGERLELSDIKKDTYIVSAVNDHIVPWMSSYKSVHLLGGDVRFVLSSGGHIAGIVNPPGAKAWYETAPELPDTAEAWRTQATRSSGSWWEDWTDWSSTRAGPMVSPPRIGSQRYPAIGDAPGEYVRG
jgi:polyhydroxyalkanoate synthase